MPIAWSNEMSVNVSVLDNQHKHFLDLLNKAYSLLSEGVDLSTEKVNNHIKELKDFAIKHFETEEMYFDKYNYSYSVEHKNEHAKLLEKINVFVKRLEMEDFSILGDLIDFLEDWLIHHLKHDDKKYIKTFNDNGLF